MKRFWVLSLGLIYFLLLIYSCSEESKEVITDAQKIVALKDVEFSYKETNLSFVFPQGVMEGQTLAQLLNIDSSKYANPANYSIVLSMVMKADNTKDNALDAKFDGMTINAIMDTIVSSPIAMIAGPFEISRNSVKDVVAEGEINLATHKQSGKYIIRQCIGGNDLETTLSPDLFYNIGSKDGIIQIPDFKQNIPTRVSEETKEFLSDLLNSGILD